ncbi:MAG: ankyrin repeat domain-containing protein, partial [Spirochaetota bacterium]
EIISYLFKERGANVNVRDKLGRTPLHYAVDSENMKIISYLLEKQKANVNVKDREGNSPLHAAVSQGNLKIVTYLLSKGADPNEKDSNGNNLLFSIPISTTDSLQILNLLLAKHVGINDRNTVLHRFLNFAGTEPISHIKLLLAYKPDIQIANQKGVTPLHLACQRGYLDVVKILLKQGANKYVVAKDQNTLLHFAVKGGNMDIVKLVVDAKMNLNALNLQQESPLALAKKTNNDKIVKLLKKLGAKR